MFYNVLNKYINPFLCDNNMSHRYSREILKRATPREKEDTLNEYNI